MENPLNLNDLLLDLSGIPENELEQFARNKFRELYLTSGNFGEMKAHDNEDVKIWESRFRHCFYTPIKWQETTQKQVLDKRRIERMQWIGALVSGQVPNSACWLVKQDYLKRVYAVIPKNYILWLEMESQGLWRFSTAYVADISHIRARTAGQKMLWKY